MTYREPPLLPPAFQRWMGKPWPNRSTPHRAEGRGEDSDCWVLDPGKDEIKLVSFLDVEEWEPFWQVVFRTRRVDGGRRDIIRAGYMEHCDVIWLFLYYDARNRLLDDYEWTWP